MGTINYMTSDYITMGIKPYSEVTWENDPDFMKEAQEEAEYSGVSMEEWINGYIQMCYEDDAINARDIIEKYNLYYFNVKIELGYYEGLSIMIENNFGYCYDDAGEKREAQREITRIKKMLQELAGVGFVSCYPGWCTGYQDYKGTIEDIDEAIKEMRIEVKNTPTWRTLELAGEV